MKLKLTKQTKSEIKRLNELYGEENSVEYDNWDKMSELEVLITDAGLYVNNAYEENKFDNLEEWCMLVGKSEYNPEYLQKHPTAVFDKITKMINEGIIVVAK